MNYSLNSFSVKLSLLLYLFIGFFPTILCSKNIFFSKLYFFKKDIKFGYIIWLVIWVIFASFRYVDSNIGGTDAPNYIYYFQNCLDKKNSLNMDFSFKCFNIIIRNFTSNYKIYFLIYYSIIVGTMISVIRQFHSKSASSVPFLLLFYLYARSFTSMRSNLAIAFIMIAIVKLSQNKLLKAYLFVFIALFTHVSAFVYAGFFIFYYIFKNKKINLIKSVMIFVIMFVVASLAQKLIITGSIPYLSNIGTGAYSSYARRSLGKNFFINYSISNLPQLILFIVLNLFNKSIDDKIAKSNPNESNKLSIIKLICLYDFFVVPIISILSIYRGYEYFYIFRLIMWGELIPIINKRILNHKLITNLIFLILFTLWILSRFEATWKTSHLLPYVFNGF